MLRILAVVAYVFLLLPIWVARKATGTSRFGPRFHRAPTAWDRPMAHAADATAATATATTTATD